MVLYIQARAGSGCRILYFHLIHSNMSDTLRSDHLDIHLGLEGHVMDVTCPNQFIWIILYKKALKE